MKNDLPVHTIYIFCDGGCRMSKNISSFSSVTILGNLIDGHMNDSLSLDRAFGKATNNQMELSGFISTITAIFLKVKGFVKEGEEPDRRFQIVVTSDSQYLTKGVNEYLPNWQRNGYKTSSRKPIKNKNLWMLIERILEMFDNVDFEFMWTRGHVTPEEGEEDYATKYNNICDANCNVLMDEIEDGDRSPKSFDSFVKAIEGSLDELEREESVENV